MNPEKLHDALNLLDEDMVASVDQLRRRKRLRWQHLGALAACLAVVCAVGVFGYGLSRDAGRTESALEDGVVAEMAPDAENADFQSGEKEDFVPGNDMVDEADLVIKPSSVLVSVEQVSSDRFTATVLESGGGYSKGDTITVLLTEDTLLVLDDNEERPIAGQPFAEGASLVVVFTPGPEWGTVYAARISFAE